MNAIQLEFTEDEFNDYLDEKYGEVSVANVSFYPSYILSELAVTVYQTAYQDWLANQHEIWICSLCGEQYTNKKDADRCCIKEKK